MNQYPKWVVNCVIIVLSLALITMFQVANANNDTIREYEELTETQRQDYDTLADQYVDLLSENQQVHLENRQLTEEYEAYKAAKMSVIPTYSYTPEEVLLLAKTAQTEAGNISNAPTSVKYVAQVVLNRVSNPGFPDTITEVIYEQKVEGIPQFSVAYNGMIDKCEVTPETLIAVQEVLLYGTDLPPYVEFFYEENVSGNWVNTLPVFCTVDGTTFAYSERSFDRYDT